MRGSTAPCLLIQTVPASSRAATFAGFGAVGGPDGGAEADVEGVGHGDGLVDGAVADDRQGGAELFLGDERVVVVDVGDEGGGVEVAGLVRVRVAAEQDPGAGVAGGFDEPGDDVELLAGSAAGPGRWPRPGRCPSAWRRRRR